MNPRERRYRLLLGLYPAGFRREYTDEMIGVLMADPRPVRSHAVSLVAGAVAARLRLTVDGPEWRRAAAAVRLFGAILLLGVALRRLLMDGLVAILRAAPWAPPLDVLDVVRVVIWAVLLVAALAGLRGLSATAASAGLIAEVVAASRGYSDAPVTFLNDFWIVTGAVVVLIASTVPGPGPRPRGWLFVVAGGVVLAGNAVVSRAFHGYFGALSFFRPGGPTFAITLPMVLAAAALVTIGVLRLEPAVRRRVIASTVPVAVVIPLVGYGFGDLLDFNMGHPDDIRLLGPVQWAALVVVPVVAFWVAAELNRRLERDRSVSPSRSSEK